MIDEFAYRTLDLPGIGGEIKQRAQDFLVEEQPLIQPIGNGDHLYLYIEKRLRSTSDVFRHLANIFDISAGHIGYAGLKDKRAVTRQYFSVLLPNPDQDERRLDRLDTDNIKLLGAQRHDKGLQRGQLMGNRFVIYIRDVEPSSAIQAKRILDRLAQLGVPNFVGQQRFGYRSVNHKIGRLLLLGKWQQILDLMLGYPLESDHAPTRAAREAYERGDYAASLELLPSHLYPDRQATNALSQGKSPQQAVMAINSQQRAFFISAVQSAIFNRVLDRRLCESESRGVDRLIVGDVAWHHDLRTSFLVDQAIAEFENGPGGRVRKRELSPSGPMWGVGMSKAGDIVGRWEQQALDDACLTQTILKGGPQGEAYGSRRSMLARVKEIDVSSGVDVHGSYVRLAFGLPRGSFATIVLREIMKCSLDRVCPKRMRVAGAL